MVLNVSVQIHKIYVNLGNIGMVINVLFIKWHVHNIQNGMELIVYLNYLIVLLDFMVMVYHVNLSHNYVLLLQDGYMIDVYLDLNVLIQLII